MAIQRGRYYTLPYLDATNQPQIVCGTVNQLKTQLRNAINECRQDDKNMEELIKLLDASLVHIKQFEVARKQRRTKQRPENITATP